LTAEPADLLLELRAEDAVGLLYRVTAALERAGLDIRWAKASTLGAAVVDVFCLAAPPGPLALDEVEDAVLAATRLGS
jgi:[protein-PII] uridylyltransferase